MPIKYTLIMQDISPFVHSKESIPNWQCPTCQQSLLKIKKGTFHIEESSVSKKCHEDENWEPDWVGKVYS